LIREVGRNRTRVEYNNSHVVPYNPALLLKYAMHINVEYVGSAAVFDYLCKYLCKGDPLLSVRVERTQDGEQRVQDYDEFRHHFNANYRTSMQAIARLLGHRIYDMSHTVKIWPIHMPGREPVVFREGNLENARFIRNPLAAYFLLNQRLHNLGNHRADDLTYATVNRRYRFTNNTWIERVHLRRNVNRVGRAGSDHDAEAQALRTLLIHVHAPESFDDLLTFTGQRFDTFQETARARGLLQSAEVLLQTIQDACEELRGSYRRCRFFAVLIFNNAPIPDTRHIFEEVLDRLVPPPPDALPERDRDSRRQRALNRIEYALRTTFQSTCEAIGLDHPSHYNHQTAEDEENGIGDFTAQPQGGHVGDDEPARQRGWQAAVERANRIMRPRQREAYENIMASVRTIINEPLNDQVPRCFIVEGPGGVGKTILNNAFIATCKAERLNVVPTAATGIASTLMTGGATAHSALCIPTDVDHNTPSRIDAHGALAQRLKETDLIIIDEFSMFHRANLEYLDRALRDIFPVGGRSHLPVIPAECDGGGLDGGMIGMWLWDG
jgi:hypothetical protein